MVEGQTNEHWTDAFPHMSAASPCTKSLAVLWRTYEHDCIINQRLTSVLLHEGGGVDANVYAHTVLYHRCQSMTVGHAAAKVSEESRHPFMIRSFEPRDMGIVRDLFTDYHAWLDIDLRFQNYDEELNTLPGKYSAQRRGALLLAVRRARRENHVAEGEGTVEEVLGCVALRQLDVDNDASIQDSESASNQASLQVTVASSSCEMKRLYVTPQARGLGVGQALVAAVLGEAEEYGYTRCFLDTLPHMHSAIALYRRFGFGEVQAYYMTPLKETIFFMKQL